MNGCAFCGACPVQWHHVCGRWSPSGPYFDGLLLPLCVRCHSREHAVLRRLGIELLPPGVDPLVHRMSRLTVIVGRLADEQCPLVVDAGSVRALHGLLVEISGSLQSHTTYDKDGAA